MSETRPAICEHQRYVSARTGRILLKRYFAVAKGETRTTTVTRVAEFPIGTVDNKTYKYYKRPGT